MLVKQLRERLPFKQVDRFFLQGNIKIELPIAQCKCSRMQKLTIFNNICCDFCMTFYCACIFLQRFILRRKIYLAYNAQNKYMYFDFEFSSFEQALSLGWSHLSSCFSIQKYDFLAL